MKIFNKMFAIFQDKDEPPAEPPSETFGAVDTDKWAIPKNNSLGADPVAIYEKVNEMINTDLHLFGDMQTRILALLALQHEIVGEDEAVVDFVRQVFENIPEYYSWLYQTIHASLASGFSVTQQVYDVNAEGKWVITEFINHAIKYFAFSEENALQRVDDGDPKDVNELVYLALTYRKRNNNRYGDALFQRIYWYWYIKREALQFWAIFTERNVSPLTVGKYANRKQKKALEKFFKTMRNQTGIAIPKEVEIDVLDKMKSGNSVAAYDTLEKYLDGKISTAILGQTLATGEGKSSGSFAQAKVHENVKYDYLKSDINWLTDFMNHVVIRPLVDYNFPNVKEYPRYKVTQTKDIDTLQYAQMLDTIINRVGLDTVTKDHAHQKLGIPYPKKDQETFKPGEFSQSAFSNPAVPAIAEKSESYKEQLKTDQETYKNFINDVK